MGADPDAIELYDENNTSATKGLDKRPEYLRMMADAKAGRIGGVMVFLQDRAWRDTDELSAFLKLAKARGVRFATSSTGEANLSDPHTIANLKSNTVTAELEVALAGRRIARATRQRARKGKAHGRAPFGWRREVEISGGRVVRSWDVIDEAEASLIRHAAAELLAGKSLRSVAAEANAGEVKPRPYAYRKGRYAGRESVQTWSTAQLKVLLLRESNAGLRIHKGEVVGDAVWPAILDRDTYQRVQLLLSDPSRRSNDAGSAPRYLLSGIASCSVCADGGKINVQTGGTRGRPAYACVGNPGSKGCFQRHWVDDLDQFIGDLVQERLSDPSFAEVGPEIQAEIDACYQQIDAQRAEQEPLGALVASKAITIAQLVAINAGIDAAVAELEARISELRPRLAPALLPDGWAGADLLTKRATVRQVIERVELVPSVHSGRVRTIATIADEVRVTFR